MNKNGFEIERKFLIAMPEQSLLAGAERSDIVQTYLLGAEGTTERVRARIYGDHTEYTHTTKKRIRCGGWNWRIRSGGTPTRRC